MLRLALLGLQNPADALHAMRSIVGLAQLSHLEDRSGLK